MKKNEFGGRVSSWLPCMNPTLHWKNIYGSHKIHKNCSKSTSPQFSRKSPPKIRSNCIHGNHQFCKLRRGNHTWQPSIRTRGAHGCHPCSTTISPHGCHPCSSVISPMVAMNVFRVQAVFMKIGYGL